MSRQNSRRRAPRASSGNPSRSRSDRRSDSRSSDRSGALPGKASGASSNRPGIHLLRDRSVARRLVRSSGAGPGDLVLEFGAGTGVVTAAIAGTGARVVAIERHPDFVSRLERRFGEQPAVRVVAADARSVVLPRRPFQVVANIPYAISTVLLRRLLGPDGTPVAAADLIVEWGFAKRMTAQAPRDLETAWWQARFELSIAGRIPSHSFDPAPSVDSAHLVIRRRTSVSKEALRMARSLLRARYRSPQLPAKEILGAHVPKKRAHRLLTSTGIDPPVVAAAVPTDAWVRVAAELSAGTRMKAR